MIIGNNKGEKLMYGKIAVSEGGWGLVKNVLNLGVNIIRAVIERRM